MRHGSILKNSNVVRIKVRCRNTPRYLLDIHNRVFEGRDDDTLGTAVELSQEIMNKIMSETGNSERILKLYPNFCGFLFVFCKML